jgi:hypothetical protein
MKRKPVVFRVGDRVAERPKTHGIIATRKESKERTAQYRTQRYGVVVGFKTKLTTRKAKQNMLVIQWDHLKSPREHASFRICHERDLESMMKNVSVPGE